MTCKKPQTPLQHKDGDYFYPLTSIDQVVMEDGKTRLSGANLVSVSTDGAPEGEVVEINAKTLDGYAADAYVRREEIEDIINAGPSNSTVVITLIASNNASISNVPVDIYNADDNTLIKSFTYNAPYSIIMPMATHFRVECGALQNYKAPEPMDFIASGANPMMIAFTYQYGKRYGFRREKAESNPSDRITYLFDAEGMTPAAMNLSTSQFNAGSWQEFIDEVARPVMLKTDGTVDYELDHNNPTLKLDGTASDITNTSYNGNAMVEFRTWKWVKRYEDTNYEYVIFSNTQFDEDYHAYAHTNANGIIQDAFYWGMFKGSNVSNKLRSIGTGSAMVSQTRATEISYATANGDGYYIIYKSGWEYIADLLTLISKSDNSQAVFGKGRCGNNQTVRALGSLKDKPAFWGNNSNGSDDIKVFWIEGFWGNAWEGMAGLINNKGKILAKMTPPYNATGDGYIDSGATPSGTSGGYISTHLLTNETGWIPIAASGSETTYLCDGLIYDNSQVDYALICGNYNHSGYCGSRCIRLDELASYTGASICSRLSFIKP